MWGLGVSLEWLKCGTRGRAEEEVMAKYVW